MHTCTDAHIHTHAHTPMHTHTHTLSHAVMYISCSVVIAVRLLWGWRGARPHMSWRSADPDSEGKSGTSDTLPLGVPGFLADNGVPDRSCKDKAAALRERGKWLLWSGPPMSSHPGGGHLSGCDPIWNFCHREISKRLYITKMINTGTKDNCEQVYFRFWHQKSPLS